MPAHMGTEDASGIAESELTRLASVIDIKEAGIPFR
jgi:hypothetical protein